MCGTLFASSRFPRRCNVKCASRRSRCEQLSCRVFSRLRQGQILVDTTKERAEQAGFDYLVLNVRCLAPSERNGTCVTLPPDGTTGFGICAPLDQSEVPAVAAVFDSLLGCYQGAGQKTLVQNFGNGAPRLVFGQRLATVSQPDVRMARVTGGVLTGTQSFSHLKFGFKDQYAEGLAKAAEFLGLEAAQRNSAAWLEALAQSARKLGLVKGLNAAGLSRRLVRLSAAWTDQH